MKTTEARRRLSRAARYHIQERGYRVSLPGRIYISFLLSRGARRVARHGPERIDEAEHNLLRLLDEAAGAALAATGAPTVDA